MLFIQLIAYAVCTFLYAFQRERDGIFFYIFCSYNIFHLTGHHCGPALYYFTIVLSLPLTSLRELPISCIFDLAQVITGRITGSNVLMFDHEGSCIATVDLQGRAMSHFRESTSYTSRTRYKANRHSSLSTSPGYYV